MPEYQIYDLDRLGAVATRRFATCRNDEEALNAARSGLGETEYAVIWQADRKLGRVSAIGLPPPL